MKRALLCVFPACVSCVSFVDLVPDVKGIGFSRGHTKYCREQRGHHS
jgi:hypothetical protein